MRNPDLWAGRFLRCAALTFFLAAITVPPALAVSLPAIRTSAANQVPACVTPDRLMRFLQSRNKRLIPRFRKIARWYRKHGDDWKVRWDYAFFQMLLETNFLTYRRPNGKWGDVDPKQNNFAGLGTTGGGVPGDSYPDVSTGVLAQIQHLVAYSGERLDDPVGPRTRLKQDVIVKLSAPVAARRPVTFQDLSGRWAVDKKYGRSINYVAGLFFKRYCKGGQRSPARQARASTPVPSAVAPAVATTPSKPLPDKCEVEIASFGGSRTVLIRAVTKSAIKLTALDVKPGQVDAMTRGFIAQYAIGGKSLGVYKSRQAALAEAFRRCPSAAAPLKAQ